MRSAPTIGEDGKLLYLKNSALDELQEVILPWRATNKKLESTEKLQNKIKQLERWRNTVKGIGTK